MYQCKSVAYITGHAVVMNLTSYNKSIIVVGLVISCYTIFTTHVPHSGGSHIYIYLLTD